ncbi:helix-hairpin-helix domain-containing protein [Aquirufa sp. ROCK-SH2]
MENDDLVDALELLVKLWDVHAINEFKSKNLSFAIRGIDKFPNSIASASEDELLQIPGVGKSVVKIIIDLAQKGSSVELEQIVEQTPPGLFQLLKIKGLGPKKVRAIWQELGITEIDDLLLACQENRLETLKGFGKSVQENVLTYILFLKQNNQKLRIDKATHLSQSLFNELSEHFGRVEIAGDLKRNLEVINELVFVVQTDDLFGAQMMINSMSHWKENMQESSPFTWRGAIEGHIIPVSVHITDENQFVNLSFQLSAHPEHLAKVNYYTLFQNKTIQSDHEIYVSQNLPYIIPAMREGRSEFDWSLKYSNDQLIQVADLQGCVHNHSTFSDGKNTLLEMAEACRNLGLAYFGIADHSQYAAYAGGLKPDRIIEQHEEIDLLNKNWTDFCILKGIEADILPDGSLDYDLEILSSFDYVVASVHAGLTMDLEKAMERLIKAIENPYTTILGHPTGRLLLTRPGYPLNMSKIIDACAANKVAIELNASPYRLDLDWRYIYEAMEKGVYISINPDAHQIDGLKDMEWGVKLAQKGGLVKQFTFNALSANEMLAYKK